MENLVSSTVACIKCGGELMSHFRSCPFCGNRIESIQRFTNQDEVKDVQTDISIQTNDQTKVQTNDHINSGMKERIETEKIVNDIISNNYQTSSKAMTQMKLHRSEYISTLSDAKKVMITVMCTIIPLFGQIAGLILSIYYISAEEDLEQRSFGKALMVSSIIVWALQCVSLIFIWILIYSAFFG